MPQPVPAFAAPDPARGIMAGGSDDGRSIAIGTERAGGAPLTTKIMVGLAAGLACGVALHAMPASALRDAWIIDGALALAGGIFVRAIKMLVVPLVFLSIVCGAGAMGDTAKLGRIGGKILAAYTATTACAVAIALALALAVRPGAGLDLGSLAAGEIAPAKAAPLLDTLLALVPENPVAAMARGEMLPVILFALLTGISLALLGPRARRVADLFEEGNAVMMTMTSLVMRLAPYGVFALVARTFASAGLGAALPILSFVLTVLAALALHTLLVYGAIVRLLARVSPAAFLRRSLPVAELAFSTSSSSATLPVTLETATARLGISRSVAAFTLPLGATVNMDGTAIMQGVAAVFIATVYGIDLPPAACLTIVLTATLASIGTAGVPGVGMVTLSMVLQSAGLPLEGIALIIGIDRILDMARTAVNVLGDLACTLAVARSEGELDDAAWRDGAEDAPATSPAS